MSITPEFLAELRGRLRLSEIVGRKVQYDKRKSNPRKRDYWACCPFHHEKSPSFHVEDDKGRYYCFGCGAKGDAVTFLMELERLSFREAVETLAGEAGMSVPALTPQAAAQAKARASLAEVMAEAATFYQQALMAPEGAAARAYLERRGLSIETIARFGLGYAPGTGRALLSYFENQDVRAEMLLRGGLAGQRDPERPPYDYFRNRLMFPIRDRQGRVIGFGGRVLDLGQEPKYLNSPETELFKKGRVLYNLDQARAASRQSGTVIVAEGYMDVIAFDRAGVPAAVAPLGTALTQEQLAELWRLVPEPVLCFDGDGAGLRAAYRALDLALAKITPEQTLRIALLPEGQDPDDLLRDAGAHAVQAVLKEAASLADLLWRRESTAGPLDTPERRAGLEARLEEAVGRIAEPKLQYHFRQDMRARLRALFRPARPQPGTRGNRGFDRGRERPGFGRLPETVSPELRASMLAQSARQTARQPSVATLSEVERRLEEARRHTMGRERLLLALAIEHPDLAQRDLERLAALQFEDRALDDLRRALLACLEEEDGLDSDSIKRHLSNRGIGSVVDAVLGCAFVRASRGPQARLRHGVDAGWQDAMSRHHMISTKSVELRTAYDAFKEASTPESWDRLMDVCRQVEAMSAPSGTAAGKSVF